MALQNTVFFVECRCPNSKYEEDREWWLYLPQGYEFSISLAGAEKIIQMGKDKDSKLGNSGAFEYRVVEFVRKEQ